MTKKEQREQELRERLAAHDNAGGSDRDLARTMQAVGKEHSINTYSTESAARQAIQRFRGGGSIVGWGLDLLERSLPRDVQVSGKTAIQTGERQAAATFLRQLLCVASGRSIRDAHKINWSARQREVFGSFAPVQPGDTWEELDEWVSNHLGPLFEKEAVIR